MTVRAVIASLDSGASLEVPGGIDFRFHLGI